MSDDRKNVQGQGPDSQEKRALTALRRLPRAQAPVEARDRAREAFLEGARAAAPDRSRRGFLWSTVGLAAALVAAFLFGSSPTDQWVVLDVVQPEGVTAPGEQFLVTGAHLDAGTLVTAAGSEVELQLGDRLRFRMLPGTRLELPAAPGRWFDRGRELTLSSGEIYGTTGGQQLGFPLVFTTEELTASLTGTTFAVFRTPEASCVCLWEGGITVVPAVGDVTPIDLPELRRVWIYRDGRAPEILPLSDMETMKLQMTEEAGLAGPGR